MKRLNFLLAIAMSIAISFSSCSDDDDVQKAPGVPIISVTSVPEITDGAEFLPGTEITFTVSATPAAEGDKLYQLTVTPSHAGDGSGCALSSHVYNTTEDVTYVYTVPFEGESDININFEVTAVNVNDISLTSSASVDVVFGVTQLWNSVENVKLYAMWPHSDNKSMINLAEEKTYSFNESLGLSDAEKAAIDLIARVEITETDTVARLGGTYMFGPAYVHLMNEWGGTRDENKPLTSYPKFFTKYEVNWDGFLPEDLFMNSTSSTGGFTVEVGDIFCFETNTVGVTGVERPNPVIIGALKVKEINLGTTGDGTDGYILFDYKYMTK